MNILPTELITHIFKTYLSNYTWNQLIYYISKLDKNEFFTEFINISSENSIKYVSKSTYDLFKTWNNSEWYIASDDILLFDKTDEYIKEYIMYNIKYYSEKIKISWERDHPLNGDYEFFYKLFYKTKGNSIKIKYNGYMYSCPDLIKCVKGSAIINDGNIEDEHKTYFNSFFEKEDSYIPSLVDIMVVMDIPISYKLSSKEFNIGEVFNHYSSIRVDL